MIEKPYFLTNVKWFVFNEEKWKYELTDEAPEKARISYAEFYNDIEIVDGVEMVIDK